MPVADPTPLHVRARIESRDSAVQRLGYKTYTDYLSSSAWLALRRRYAEEIGWICNLCGAEDGLQLHHRTYERVGKERLDDLMPLCTGCHGMVHSLERRGESGLDFEGVIDAARATLARQEAALLAARRATEDETHRVAAWAKLETLRPQERISRALAHASVADRSAINRVLYMARRRRKPYTAQEFPRVIRRIEEIAYRDQPLWPN